MPATRGISRKFSAGGFHRITGILILISTCSVVLVNGTESIFLDAKTAMAKAVTHNGYPFEEHTVTTEDGYILGMQRIRHGLNDETVTERPAVLLMHGLFGTAEHWISLNTNKGMGYVLADQGYDVWFGNSRGNLHSRGHIRLNSSADPEFWLFSWHEMGMYDLPATIDYIISQTGQKKIFFVGYSQGCLSFFVMASKRPEYNRKIRLMVALAPPVYMGNLTSQLGQILGRSGNDLKDFIGEGDILLNSNLGMTLLRSLCNGTMNNLVTCGNILISFIGFDPKRVDAESFLLLLSTAGGPGSVMQFLHFSQIINSGLFQHYDYGPSMNLVKYNSKSPPKYKLRKVSAPVAIFYSQIDQFVPVKTLKKLKRALPNVAYYRMIPDEKFDHIEFVFGKYNVEMLNGEIIALFKKY